MYTCKETIELLTTADTRPLTFKEKFGVKMHLLMCKLCNAYYKQIQFIKRALGNAEISEVEAQQSVEKITTALKSNSEFLR